MRPLFLQPHKNLRVSLQLKLMNRTIPLRMNFFKVRIDPSKGSVVSVIDKKSGREMVDQSSNMVLVSIFMSVSANRIPMNILNAYLKVRLSWEYRNLAARTLTIHHTKELTEVKQKVTYNSDAVSAKADLQFTNRNGESP